MKMINLFFKPLLALGLATAIFSCNNNSETPKEEFKKEADTATTKAPPPAAAFTPFDIVEIAHTVKDYAKWRPFFDMDSVSRKASGLDNIIVGRDNDKANDVLIVLNVADVKKAKDFVADPRLKDVMTKHGVISKPDIEFFHVIRFNPDSKEKQWVTVTHKVKDFDAWVKVYDGEGKEKRATEGMVDVVLARGIDDPNLVHIVFDITDMAKAKTAISSEEKKKLMMSAGVEGVPKIQFYTTAE